MNPDAEEQLTRMKQSITDSGEGGAEKVCYSGRLYSDLQTDKDIKPFPYAVKGLFCLGEVTMVVADAKLGKTWMGFQLAVCADRGQKFLDRETRKMRTVYFDMEMGAFDERQRLGAVARQLKVADEALEIACISGDEQQTPVTLNQLEQGLEGFLDAIHWEFKDLLIVIDTFAEVAGGMDENKADDTRVALATLRQMARKRNCAVVLFHHTNKYGKTYRGSSAIRGAVDNLLYLRWANKEEKKAAQVGKGQPFVVLYDDARRRRAPFEPIHLSRVLIPKAGCEGAYSEGEAERIDDSLWDGFIWKALGPVGKEHSDGDVGGATVFWQDGESDEVDHASSDVQAGSEDEEGMAAAGKRERVSVVIRAFKSFTDQLPRKKLEHYYAAVKHQSEESGKGAVRDAIELGWIVKDSPAARAPYRLTEKGIRELKGLSPSCPPDISERSLTGKVLGEGRTPSEEPVGADQGMQGEDGDNG